MRQITNNRRHISTEHTHTDKQSQSLRRQSLGVKQQRRRQRLICLFVSKQTKHKKNVHRNWAPPQEQACTTLHTSATSTIHQSTECNNAADWKVQLRKRCKRKNEEKWKEIENKRGPRNGNGALVVVIDAIRGQEYRAKNIGSGFFFAGGSMAAAADGATLAQ